MIVLLLVLLTLSPLKLHTDSNESTSQKLIYEATTVAFQSTSSLAKIISPLDSSISNEWLFLSQLCSSAAEHILTRPSKKMPSSHSSWDLNHYYLSQIPAFSDEDKKLLSFLKTRWLSKACGFSPKLINWVCPCFGISVQAHPETTPTYARSPSLKLSKAYTRIAESWKKNLPHPEAFPLILTRPFNLQDYLPSYLNIPEGEKIDTTVEKLAAKIKSGQSKIVLDFTHILDSASKDQKIWLQTWKTYQLSFLEVCKEHNIDLDKLICIERVQKNDIGGIRLLPLMSTQIKLIDSNYEYLLGLVSTFGLSANQVELDRWIFSSKAPVETLLLPKLSKEEFTSYLFSFKENWRSNHPQKDLLVKATLKLLTSLLESTPKDKWDTLADSPTKTSLLELSFAKIKNHFQELETDTLSFFETATCIEQIHANLSALIEICTPFTYNDFSKIYTDILSSIPENLKPFISASIHSSGMTSLAGIFKATEKTLGKIPKVLYGENTYFECINAAKLVTKATPIEEASETDLKEVDLIMAQFNPVLRKFVTHIDEYRVEKIRDTLEKTFKVRQGKPLTLAIDSTLDFINSSKIQLLLEEFQEEIKTGKLCVMCYRSGLKYDLLGMDNYAGAPFYMIHNRDDKWSAFDLLLNDPVLMTDKLSLNLFCLAYKSAADYLELYRKQIFDNTRALLNNIPKRLLTDKKSRYRVIPIEEAADPSFIDIRIFGPFHSVRGAALVAGSLSIKCLEEGHGIFYRLSLGFYHPNLTMLFDKDCTTIRLTLGLDSKQVDTLTHCFETIDALVK